MGKYLMIVLILFITGMGIGILRDPPQYGLFYAMLAGAIVVILYAPLKSRWEQKKLRRQKRRSK